MAIEKYKAADGWHTVNSLPPALIGVNDPSTLTEGIVGQLYLNTQSGETFICSSVQSGNYTWTKITATHNSSTTSHTDIRTSLGSITTTLSEKLNSSLKGAANGLAELDANGLVPSAQLPSYVDDVLEYTNRTAFPATGETGKIYVALDTNLTYRWGGSDYTEISASLALGNTSSTAYRGDYGQTAYTHSQASGNPHSTTYEQLTSKPSALSEFTDDLGSTPTHTHSQYLVSTDIANKEDKGYLTMEGTSYPIRVSTTDSGLAGYITFVIQS